MPDPAPNAPGPAHQRRISLHGACWGLGIGAAGGATTGTLLYPGVGTVVGLGWGAAIAVVPTLIGTCALVAAGRPGTDPAVFRRRVRGICGGLAAGTVGIGLAVIVARTGGDGPFVVPSTIGVLTAAGLLAWCARSISALSPDPAGRDDRGGAGATLAVLTVLSALVVGGVAWDKALSPDARGRGGAEALRDDVGDAMGLTFGEDSYVDDTEIVSCPGQGRAYRSVGYADAPDGRAAHALVVGGRDLVRRGFDVSSGSSANRRWVYGESGDRSVRLSRHVRVGTVEVTAADGCLLGEPAP